MFSKKVFLLLFLLIIAIGCVSSVSANDLTDDVAGDSVSDEMGVNEDIVIEDGTNEGALSQINAESKGADVLSLDTSNEVKTKSFKELQDMIDNAFDGGTVTLTSDYTYDSSFSANGISINKAITINGNGYTIDGAGSKRIFAVYKNAVLNNIRFVNGTTSSASGGAICALCDKLTVNDCTFIDNEAGEYGGAISASGQLIINRCNFIDNHADYGGAIAAFYPDSGYQSVDISNSVFDGNWADSYGGAIYLYGFSTEGRILLDHPIAQSSIKNTEFTYNEAYYGGAIFNSHYTTFLNAKFSDNYAGGGGGAIYMPAGIYSANDAGKVAVAEPAGMEFRGNTQFIDNYAEYYGGAIRIGSNDNYASAGVKGILRVYDNALFQSNYGYGPGGALSLDRADAIVKNARFINNTADDGASAMYGGTAINCVFIGNTNPATQDTTIINSINSKLSLSQSGSAYNAKTLTVKLVNSNNNAGIANVNVVVKFSNGKQATIKTDSKGIAKYNVPLSPGSYSATVSFAGNDYYFASSANAKVVIKKATPKITAKKATLKLNKVKKYTVTLKSNGKVVKKVKVTLKVNGKNYKAKTNAKGKAVFKLKLAKKGTFKAKIKSAGDKNYKSASKKATIVCK